MLLIDSPVETPAQPTFTSPTRGLWAAIVGSLASPDRQLQLQPVTAQQGMFDLVTPSPR